MATREPSAAMAGAAPAAEPACPACDGTRFAGGFERLGRRYERCVGCGTLCMRPLPSTADLAAYYARSYDGGSYAYFAQAAPVRRAIASLRVARVRAAHPGARRWLDVGASTGEFVAAVGAQVPGAVAEGVEVAPEAVAMARAAGLAVVEGTIETFTPGAPFDVVTAFDVLEHLRAPGVLLERARAWLAPGGVLALTVPDLGSLPARLMGRRWYYLVPDHLHLFDRGGLGRLLARHGFVVRGLEPAHKVLTLRYVVGALRDRNPLLARLAESVTGVLPAALLDRPRRIAVGELFAVAAPG